MKGRVLPVAGMILGLGSVGVAMLRNSFGPLEILALVAGAACFLAWGLARGGQAAPGNALNGAVAGAYALVVAACLAVAFLIALPRLPSFDLTRARLNTLSGVSKQWLERSLADPIRLVAFLESEQVDRYRTDFDRLREVNSLVSYEILDPLRDAQRALELVNPGENVFPGDVFAINERTGRKRRVHGFERLPEGDLMNAIVAVTIEGPATVYFLTGHGEYGIVEEKGNPAAAFRTASTVALNLRQRGFDTRLLDLGAGDVDVPEDALCVVSLNQQTALLEGEVAALERYLFERGGKVILAAGVGELRSGGTRLPAWKKIAARMGVELLDEVVADFEGKARYADQFCAVPSFVANGAEIPRNSPSFQGLFLERSRAMRVMRPPPPGAAAEPTLFSSKNSVRLPLPQFMTNPTELIPSDGTPASEPIVVYATKRHESGDDALQAKMLLVGSPLLFTDRAMTENSIQLFVGAVEQMNPDSLATRLPIPARALTDQIVEMSDETRRFMLIFHLLFLPGALFFGGLGLALLRRSASR